VRRTLRRSIGIAAALSGGASIVLVLAGGWLIRSGQVAPSIRQSSPDRAALWASYTPPSAVAILLNAAIGRAVPGGLATAMAITSITLSVVLRERSGTVRHRLGNADRVRAVLRGARVVYLPRFPPNARPGCVHHRPPWRRRDQCIGFLCRPESRRQRGALCGRRRSELVDRIHWQLCRPLRARILPPCAGRERRVSAVTGRPPYISLWWRLV